MLAPFQFNNILKTKGRALGKSGENNDIGLKKDDVLKALEFVVGSPAPVLGIDVIHWESGRPEHICDNKYDEWHYEQISKENWQEYLLNSQQKALEYVKNMQDVKGHDIYFVISVKN